MYEYVGPKEFLKQVNQNLVGEVITSRSDIKNWINERYPNDDDITVTFVIDLDKNLRINERRSEHVVCAGGKPVLSAGEITFEQDENKNFRIVQITNQSTGYCPDPESWKCVKENLSKTDIEFPEEFTMSYIFRFCDHCENLNIVKDAFYECFICGAELMK